MRELRRRRRFAGLYRGAVGVALVAVAACGSPRQNSLIDGGAGGSQGAGSGGMGGATGGRSDAGASGGLSGGGGTPAGSGGQPGTGGTSLPGSGGAAGSPPAAGTGGSASGGGGSGAVTGTAGMGAVTGSGGVGTGGVLGTGGMPSTGGAGGGQGCAGATKLCNGSCVPLTTCCGGCSGTTPVCGSAGVCVGRDAGTACMQDSECTTGHCADGVCCNATCTGQCESCSTASAKGTCTPVTTPRTPCAGTGTCAGLCDGTAAHRAACVFPSSTTSCGAAASCTNGMATTAALCNGSGSCTASTMMSCMYGCRTDGTAGCATSCAAGTSLCGGTSCVDLSQPAHCGPSCQNCTGTMTSKCSGATGGCVACLINNDCKGTNSVCSSSHTCQCHPKSSTNLLTNGNFDTIALTGWTQSSGVQFGSDDDADGCNPASGYISLTSGTDGNGSVSQCANNVVGGATYYFGVSYKQSQSNTVFCSVAFYSQSGCSGDTGVGNSILGASVLNAWSRLSGMVVAPANAMSVSFTCSFWSSPGQLDQAYVNTSDNY